MTVITKLNAESLAKALNQAELLREQDDDPYLVAHGLLYLSQRNEYLEAVVDAAQEYVRFGEDTILHSKLLKALGALEDYEAEAELAEDPKFGLE